MSQSQNPAGRRVAPLLVGFVLAVLLAVGIGMAIGYASFSDSSAGAAGDAEDDRDLACASVDQLPDESFEKLIEDGIGPNLFRLTAIGSHATAAGDAKAEDDPWYDSGMEMQKAANTLEVDTGNQALEDIRDLCAQR